MNRIFPLLILLACISEMQCGDAPTVADPGGSTMEVVVSLDGNLVNEDGSPARGAQVYLRPADYLPDISAKISAHLALRSLDTTFTDSLGHFSFDSIAPGTYTLECLDGEPGNGALIDSVIVGEPDSTVELATNTLKPLGNIMGQIQLPESLDASKIRVMAYGLDRIVTPDSMGDYAISGLAEGTYTLRILILGGQAVGADSIVVLSGSTTWAPKSVLPGADKIYAPKTSGIITVDGMLDEADWSAAREIKFSSPGYSDNLVRVRALWDSLFLYVAFLVKDSLVTGLPEDSLRTNVAEFDAVEFFLDPEHDATPIVAQGDRQVVVYTTGRKYYYEGPTEAFPTDSIICMISAITGGFGIEIRMPWSVIGKTPVEGLTMGALFTNSDRDMNFVQFDWLGIRYQGTGVFKRPNMWGDLILTP